MELVERYIAAVQRDLPEAKRSEIGRELKANILDQLDALTDGETPDTEQVEQVLLQMGPPEQVARQFVPVKPLIAAEFMPSYLLTLYIVLGILFVLQVLSSTMAWLDQDFGLLWYLKSVLSGFIDDGCFAFTAITVGFIASSHSNEKQCNRVSRWHPRKLPAVDAPWQHISLQDIFTDLATYVFVLVVVWYPLSLSPAELAEKSVLLSESARNLLLWFTPVVLAGIALSVWQLSVRYWNQTMLQLNILLNVAIVGILVTLAFGEPLLSFNADYWLQVFGLERLERGLTISLLFTACIPAWEVLRDGRRLWQSR